MSYDALGRPVQSQVTADSTSYTTTSTYDIGGRIGTVTYPSGFAVTYTYNTTGYLTQISGGSPGVNYWTANSYDAEANVTQTTAGNGIVTSKDYNPDTGRIDTIRAGASNSVQNLSFTFNTLGNLTLRVDTVTQTTDTMSYDGLNRLTQAVTSNPSLPLNVTKTVGYDAIGNITNKSDVGNYTYDPARIHAVASIAPGATGTVTASYTYDGDGNMLTGRGRTVTWTSFDMVSQITQGANSLGFTYDSEHARLKQVSSDGSTKYYLNDPISGIMQEKVIGASLAVTWNDYIMLGGEMVALHVTAATPQIRYFHKDHLGSIVALTNESGTVVERDSFDAWGQRRNPAGQDDPLYPGMSLTSQITRGFTGHEQLDSVGLVHMNGRIYEPIIGKMMSADPTVPNPIDGQSYNRYAYVANNPLSLTDPTGFSPDPPHGIQVGHGNNNHHLDDQAAHFSVGVNSRAGIDADSFFDPWGDPLTNPGGDIAGGANPLANQLAEDPGAWDVPGMALDWSPALEVFTNPAHYFAVTVPRLPFRGIAWLGAAGEELCGVCFDPNAIMATMAPGGPPGWAAVGIDLGVAMPLKGAAWAARVVAGDEAFPLGFESFEQFSQACSGLCAALEKAGITDATIGVRGSSVTGYSSSTGAPFGLGTDIDFFVESRQLMAGLKTSKTIPGFAYSNVIGRSFPAVREWERNWSTILGRDVSVGGFQPGMRPNTPSILAP